MRVENYKADTSATRSKAANSKQLQAWTDRIYPVPTPSRSSFRWKASALRGFRRLTSGSAVEPVTITVPALYNSMPAEAVAMGWLNEIDALQAIRQRIISAAKITGWDVFTFHTLHNCDHFFDSTISAVRDTWVNEGSLNRTAIQQSKARFGRSYDYYRVQPRLIENLVFQSSVLEWLNRRATEVPLRIHVLGTGLLSALVSTGALSFERAVETAMKIGAEWDSSLQWMAEQKAPKGSNSPEELSRIQFEEVQKLLDGRSTLSLDVSPEQLPVIKDLHAPSAPFWYSRDAKSLPSLIETAADALAALETLNIKSWSRALPKSDEATIRGFLVSPLHAAARGCRWSVSNFLLATPSSVEMFLEHIATLGRGPIMSVEPEIAQNRFRLSRIKVTGP
jgi:hypothetical protein